MAVLTHTYTKTYTVLHAWASTIPWECTNSNHNHDPMVDDPCAIDDCNKPLKFGEECYAVIELPRDEQNREQWVCWRHVRPDDGPISAL